MKAQELEDGEGKTWTVTSLQENVRFVTQGVERYAVGCGERLHSDTVSGRGLLVQLLRS